MFPKIKLPEITFTFVPFAVLLSIALLLPEMQDAVTLERVLWTIRVTTIIAIPALCLYALGPEIYKSTNYGRLYWTFAFIIYFFHFLYAVFGIFGGDIGAIYEAQGVLTATNNFVLTFWWLFDVILIWAIGKDDGWIGIQRFWVHLLALVNFMVANIALNSGIVSILGIVMAVCVGACIIVRIISRFSDRKADAGAVT